MVNGVLRVSDSPFSLSGEDVLSGTPAPNHPSDVSALIDFCWPGQARNVLPESVYKASPLTQDMAAASQRIAPLFARTNKSELGLPPPVIKVLHVRIGSLQRNIYDALRHRFAGPAFVSRNEQTNLARMGRIVMYLLEAASNPALLGAGSSSADPKSFRHPSARRS